MEQYTVTGMSCAACSARVEKAVSKVPGVESCSVSLLTNSMGANGVSVSHRQYPANTPLARAKRSPDRRCFLESETRYLEENNR